MGEIVRFVSKSERERARLIREARAIYDGIFPPDGPIRVQLDRVPAGHSAREANAYPGGAELPS
jgi:hypothetical protein